MWTSLGPHLRDLLRIYIRDSKMSPGAGTFSPEVPFSLGGQIWFLSPFLKEIHPGGSLGLKGGKAGRVCGRVCRQWLGLGAAFTSHSCHSPDSKGWEAASRAERRVCKYCRKVGVINEVWIFFLDP